VQVDVLVPYARGDLIDRIHREGELVAYEHTGLGTQVVARVGQALAAELAELS
jgi:GTP-binding protein HflX